ncbi:MAG: prolyl oligopeptidase family serine peptidase [Gammaproteobacteria bacterium]
MLLPAALPAAQAPAFTIDQVMQAPYPSDLTAAPSGRSVAWVFDTRGVRNVWVAESAPGAKARQITAFTQDDGFSIGSPAWSADGKMIAFTRGSSLEDDAPANVNNSPDGPTPREVWVAAVSGGAAHKVGVGYEAAFSADGSRLLFINKGQLFAAAVSGESAPQALIVDNGAIASFIQSPDGKRLAFVSARARHSVVGVYDFAAKTIVWMSPSMSQDASPVFSPNGSQIAFIRVPWEKAPVFVARRAGAPWSVWVADVVTGKGRRAWIADAGAGSAFASSLSAQNLFWTAQDQLVFPWEKTGWLQLYAVPVQGGAPRALTSGQFEVAHIAHSADRRRLAFSSNQDDTDRLHVWTIDGDGGQPKRVTDSRAVEDCPQAGADGTLFALQSDANQPLRPVMLSSRGKWEPLAAEVIPASFPSARLVTPASVSFPAKDGQQVHGQIFLPTGGSASTPHPTIMFFHGGPRRQMLLGFHPMGAYNWMYALNQYFAAKGYIVLSVNYRGGIGYGMDYREAKDFGPDGGSELNDLLGAVTYLQGRKDVDVRKIGIWGASYGGLMTALGLARASDSIAAGVDYAGVYNWDTFMASIGLPVEGEEATRKAVASSPIATIGQWRSPVLVVQADDDRSVPASQASELIEALIAHQIPYEEVMMPNEIHDLARYGSWIQLFNDADDFFDRHLRK